MMDQSQMEKDGEGEGEGEGGCGDGAGEGMLINSLRNCSFEKKKEEKNNTVSHGFI